MAIENYLLLTIEASYQEQVENWIASIEKFIDQLTGRNFVADSATSARVFDGNGRTDLLIDDCVAITKVEAGNDECGDSFTEVLAAGSGRYLALPNNYASLGVPIRKLHLLSGYWLKGLQNARITAKWGYSTVVPDDIKFAVTVIVAGLCCNLGQLVTSRNVQSERIGEYSVSYANDANWQDFARAKQILESYKKFEI